jgi:hypothetical protein
VQKANQPVLLALKGDKELPVAAFKNSLRDWHVRWKAQRLTQTLVAGPADNRSTPGNSSAANTYDRRRGVHGGGLHRVSAF